MYLIKIPAQTKKYVWLSQLEKEMDFNSKDYANGLFEPTSSIPYKVMNGTIFEDAIGSSGLDKIFHKRIKDTIESAGLTGFQFHPVSIKLKDELNLDYYILRPENHCNPFDFTNSIIKPNELMPFMDAYYGFELDSSFNQDLMMPKDMRRYVISDKAAAVLKSIEPPITGLEITHQDDCFFSKS